MGQLGCSPDLRHVGERIDPTRKFVRVAEVRPDGFIAFDFAIGEPEIYVEMLLPRDAFDAFCREHNVTLLNSSEVEGGCDPLSWGLREAAGAAANPPRPAHTNQEMGLN